MYFTVDRCAHFPKIVVVVLLHIQYSRVEHSLPFPLPSFFVSSLRSSKRRGQGKPSLLSSQLPLYSCMNS